MKVRSDSAGQPQAAVRTEAGAADAAARGQTLLSRAGEHALVAPALLGLPKASLDALAVSLAEGAALALQRRGGAGE